MNFDAAQSEIDAVQRAALSALAIEGAAGRGVSIVLTDDETINAPYFCRGTDGPSVRSCPHGAVHSD